MAYQVPGTVTASQIAAGVAAGDFTATEVAQASLDAIEAREGGVQAFLHAEIPTTAVGLITKPKQAKKILKSGAADAPFYCSLLER